MTAFHPFVAAYPISLPQISLLKNGANIKIGKRNGRNASTATCSANNESRMLHPFPLNYSQLISQAQRAAQSAIADGCKLLEVEFPTSGLDSVPGDGEGGQEMNNSVEFVGQFCGVFNEDENSSSVRIFFPDKNDMQRATEDGFESKFGSFQLDYLTKPSGLEDLGLGFGGRAAGAELKARVKDSDKIFVAAYPYFNVNEMLAIEQLHAQVGAPTGRPIIVFNGEMDRIRSGYYPAFFYPKLAKLAQSFLPKFQSVFYVHNFKGRGGGKLFRVYPGPWQVLQGDTESGLTRIHTQESMPSLKEVALNILKI